MHRVNELSVRVAMLTVRTPKARFAELSDFPYAGRYSGPVLCRSRCAPARSAGTLVRVDVVDTWQPLTSGRFFGLADRVVDQVCDHYADNYLQGPTCARNYLLEINGPEKL